MSQIEVTIHPVTTDQLAKLMELTRDKWRERLYAFIGAAVAVTPSAAESFLNAYYAQPPIPLSILHLVEVITFVTSLVGAGLIKWFTKPREDAIRQVADNRYKVLQGK